MHEKDVDGRTLTAAFERAVGGLGPDLGPLIAGAAVQGRSIRRRRRLTVAGAVTAVAALAVGGTVAARTDGGTGGTVAVAAATASPSASAAPTPGRSYPKPFHWSDDNPEQPQPGSGPNTGKVAMTGHAALSVLTRALPANGRTSGYSGYSELAKSTSLDPERVLVWAGMLYDDGAGPANVRLQVEGNLGAHYRPGSSSDGVNGRSGFLGYDDHFNCDVLNRSGQFRYCSGSVLPDGSHLLVIERQSGEILSREVDLLRPDKTMVTVDARNTASADGQPENQVVIRKGLPLSLDQLKAAAMSTGLQEWITPEEAQQAEQTVRPFHDTVLEHRPSGTASPRPGSAG
ncbi:hypothetical protein ABZW30_04620 [Kitasatospora sp. NPDC004669]|uniref:hypothetical protein n=1 Tax=Kitasatospora sp. NPDC004669 TaxID=3154555 RepID=UPI0033A88A29